MNKYIVNHDIEGMVRKNISDAELKEGTENLVVVVLDSSTEESLKEYYNNITDILLSKNKLVIIIIQDESDIGVHIANLACLYKCYNIYEVSNRGIIDKDYMERVESRTPNYSEVQAFLGGGITAYSEIGDILLEVRDLLSEGDVEGLKRLLDKHEGSVNDLNVAVDYIRNTVKDINSDSLRDEIIKINEALDESITKLNDIKKVSGELQDENAKLEEDLEKTRGKLEEATKQVESMRNMSFGNGSRDGHIIKTYAEFNTSLIKCRVKSVVYFKEITTIPYINSLILSLMESIKLRKLRVKLLIYDNTSFPAVYKPLNVISSSEYLSKRSNYISMIDKLVVAEPNPVILEDILTFNNKPYDVLIIYDRMKQTNDLITGNNIYKYYIINSTKDFNNIQGLLNITDKSNIITRSDSGIGGGALDIPKIEDYSNSTETAKISKYIKAVSIGNKQPIIQNILDRARIEAM